MNLTDPTLTIQNAGDGQWLTTLEFSRLGDGQRMTFTLLVPRGDAQAPLVEVQRQVLQRAQELIGHMLAGEGQRNIPK